MSYDMRARIAHTAITVIVTALSAVWITIAGPQLVHAVTNLSNPAKIASVVNSTTPITAPNSLTPPCGDPCALAPAPNHN